MKKGFTLIELLVVIAIIGILSSVVLASLTTARTRGQAAAIQSEMSNMRAQAELYYSTNSNTYGSSSDCTTSSVFNGTNGLQNLIAGVDNKGGGLSCKASGSAWAAKTTTAVGGTYFCVDSTGMSTSSPTSADFNVADSDCDAS